MDQNIGQKDSNFSMASVEAPMRETNTGEKSNKCNQCDFASAQAGNLRRHLKTHSGEKPNKCSQSDCATSQAGNLRTHLKIHSGKNQINAISGTMHSFKQAI